MSQHFYISTAKLDLDSVKAILDNNAKLELSEDAKQAILRCRNFLDEKMEREHRPVYGINTGFGSLCNIRISGENLSQLQENLVMSHACGTGEEVAEEIVRLMLLLKIQSLSYGHSGVQLLTVQRLIDFYNSGIYPVVYTQGSLGASGDLAPLAHLALPLLGRGEVRVNGRRLPAAQVLKENGWEPVVLQSKEGLALLNGTQFMSAYGVWCLLEGEKLSGLADLIGAISLEAFDGRTEPFNALIHQIRPHNGQLKTAERMNAYLKGSELAQQEKKHVQDPYSFRCIPQVHGASKDAISHVLQVFTTEINSVTDNPNVFVDEDEIISGGNFHGQPLALALDYLCLALSELGSISERRTYQLISGLRGLPAFLVHDPGLHSGFMIPQYTAASIASQNKQLSAPASVDSIVSSNGQEDHVSMGANAATKCFRVVENLRRILAIELMNASQAMEFRRPLRSSDLLEEVLAHYTKVVPFVSQDRVLHDDIEESVRFLKEISVTDGMPSF